MNFKNVASAWIVGLLFLSGCSSSMSKKECESTDFYQTGMKDGKSGKGPEHFDQLATQCSSQGVNLTRDKYDYGYKVGIVDYCSESRGVSDAKKGVNDSVCVKQAVPPYATGYNRELSNLAGEKQKQLAQAQKQRAADEQKQNNIQNDLNKIQQQSQIK